MDYVRCPQCDLPAEITDRFALASTDGPMDFIKIACIGGHWYTPALADVEVLQVAPERRPVRAFAGP
jgi:hypothetical protein